MELNARTIFNTQRDTNHHGEEVYAHPAHAVHDTTKAAVPKNSLSMIYQKSRDHVDISKKDFITWSNQGPHHALQFSSVFVCPLTGEAFPAGHIFGDNSSCLVKHGLYWYPKKLLAENAAAARAFDCLEFRRVLQENETYSYIGGNQPYGKAEQWQPPDNGTIPENIVKHIREAQTHALEYHDPMER